MLYGFSISSRNPEDGKRCRHYAAVVAHRELPKQLTVTVKADRGAHDENFVKQAESVNSPLPLRWDHEPAPFAGTWTDHRPEF